MKLPRGARWLLAALLLASLGTLASVGQNNKTSADDDLLALENQAAQFLENVSLGQLDSAYSDLLTNSQILKQADALAELKTKTKELARRYGRYQGMERIAAQRVGQDVVVLRYLYKCEQLPVVWYFTFYRPAGASEMVPTVRDWRVISLRFDTRFEALGQRG